MSADVSQTNSSQSCLAAVFLGPDQPVALRELPVPVPQCREAIVRVECCTVCGSDLHTVAGARQEPTPSILGHEILGRVTDVGDPPPCDIDGQPLQPGDRVTWSTCISCGDCDRCRSGMPQKCRSLAKYGHAVAEGRHALSGGLAEMILLRPGTAVVKIAASIPDDVICPVNCATATVAASLRQAGDVAGHRVLIFGAGMLGLTASAMAKSLDAAQIVICDLNADRLTLAKQFGADCGIEWHDDRDELQRRIRRTAGTEAFDVVLELSGSPNAVESAVGLGDIGARIVLVGSVMKSRAAQLDPEMIVRRWLTIRGVHNYAPEDLRTAVTFLYAHHSRFPFAGLVTATYSLSEINEALEFAIRERPVRVAIRP